MEFEIGDLVIDPDLGIGLVTEVMVDDNDFDGLIYLVFYAKVDEHVLEYAYELIPYCPGHRD
mgnify:FL=1